MRSYAFSLLAVAATASAASINSQQPENINSQQPENLFLKAAAVVKSGLTTLDKVVEAIAQPSDAEAFFQALNSMSRSFEPLFDEVQARALIKQSIASVEEYQAAESALAALVPDAEAVMDKAKAKQGVIAQDPQMLVTVEKGIEKLADVTAEFLDRIIEEELPNEGIIEQAYATTQPLVEALLNWNGAVDAVVDALYGEYEEEEGNGQEEADA